MSSDFTMAVDAYPWESKEQREGYLAVVQYQRNFGIKPTLPINPVIAFLIQKDKESHDYWVETVGNQVTSLENQIRALQEEVLSGRRELDTLVTAMRAQTAAMELMSRRSVDSASNS